MSGRQGLYFLLCKVKDYSLVDSVLQSLRWFILIERKLAFWNIKGCERGTPLCTFGYLKIILALGVSLLFSFVLYFVMQELTEDSLAARASLVWCGLGVLSSLLPAACLYDSQTHLQQALWLSWFCLLHILPPIYTCICITLLT